MLEITPPKGKDFLHNVDHILERERNWVSLSSLFLDIMDRVYFYFSHNNCLAMSQRIPNVCVLSFGGNVTGADHLKNSQQRRNRSKMELENGMQFYTLISFF